jgi:hypothetical protein
MNEDDFSDFGMKSWFSSIPAIPISPHIMSINIFEKHPDSKTIEEIIQELNDEKSMQYMSKVIDQFIFDQNGIQLLGEEDFNDSMLVVNITQDLSIRVETTSKTFQLAIFPDREFDDKYCYPLSDLGSVVRRVLAEKAEKSQNAKSGEMQDDDDEFMKTVDFGLDDVDNNAQCLLRLSVREQLLLYPHVAINDTLQGERLEGEELSDYLLQEVLTEKLNDAKTDDAAMPDDSFRAFAVPITFFGDEFTLCFSPRVITVQKGNGELGITPATEFHTVLNAMFEFLSEEAQERASAWKESELLVSR